MFTQNLVVDFLGAWDYHPAYHDATEELLDQEIDDIRIEGPFCHLETVTSEYDVEAWIRGL